jgi:ectoine hydroxylase-related dioxygenase (phytanoyl-CoA dioxygenase family)
MMPTDYGLQSSPVTGLFKQPEGMDGWEPYILSEEQLLQYETQGYVAGIQVLDDGQLQALREELGDLTDPNHEGREFFYEYHTNESTDPDKVLFHAIGAWRVRPAFHDLLWAPAFRMAAYQLLGGAYRLFHDQLFCKPAHHGSVVAWHQDFSYWTWTKPMSHLTCWIALDDATTENGCMYYVPGSHKWGLVKKPPLAADMDAVRQYLSPSQILDFEEKIPMELKAGQATFHHPLMMHGSYENRSASSRRATLVNVFSDGVVSNLDWETSDSPGADNYPKVPKGQKMGGTYYPLLLDPQTLPSDIPALPPAI